MKTFFETVAVAFSMFSEIPVPSFKWSDKNMRYALCAFPLVGAVCGAAVVLWAKISFLLNLNGFLRGAVFCLIPLWITGGIHLDGYADCCDAFASCGDTKKKMEILSDPHCGAFAIIRLCGYFVMSLALWCTFLPSERSLFCVSISFVLSRTLSAFAVTAFPMAKNTGLAHTFSHTADKKRAGRVLACYMAVLAVLSVVFGKIMGAALLFAAAAVFIYYYVVSKKHFGGITGDLAGWFLQKAEIAMLAAIVFCGILEGL